ncbi:hypothetical protein Daesc_003197 [Daldinia eschscholtzii]|uniref:Uncharacterized protein n=1 Tax=Daldinia eschscholtzii TaxID=292717 RepID=A0AAX6MT28_9PEZI
MQLTAASLFLASLLASNAVALPLAARQASSVEGQACTDGTFDGTCRADGRCGLEIPPNEVSFRFVAGQCGVAARNRDPAGKLIGNNGNSTIIDDDAATDDGTDDGIDDDLSDDGSVDDNDSIAGDSDDGTDDGLDSDDEDGGNQASVEGQKCTDGTFNGTCRADGRCGLDIPPNELSIRIIPGQCGL